jgi:diaminopimelate decarboxylase
MEAMQLVKDYQVQGLNMVNIGKEFGTPLYIYDADKILYQYNSLVKAFEGVNIRIKYAAKALTNQAVLKLLKKAGSGIDVVSIEEAKLGFLAGFEKTDIMFTPSCVDFDEIREAVKMGLTINIDSIPFLEKFGQEYGDSYPCCIRINPHI